MCSLLVDMWQWSIHRISHSNEYLFHTYHQQHHAFDAVHLSAQKAIPASETHSAGQSSYRPDHPQDAMLVYTMGAIPPDGPASYGGDRPAWTAGYASGTEWLVREGAACALVSNMLGLGVHESALLGAAVAALGVLAHTPDCVFCFFKPGSGGTPGSAAHRCTRQGGELDSNYGLGLIGWSDWLMGTYVSPDAVQTSQQRIALILSMSVSSLKRPSRSSAAGPGRAQPATPSYQRLVPSSPAPSSSSSPCSKHSWTVLPVDCTRSTLQAAEDPPSSTIRRPFGRIPRRSPATSDAI